MVVLAVSHPWVSASSLSLLSPLPAQHASSGRHPAQTFFPAVLESGIVVEEHLVLGLLVAQGVTPSNQSTSPHSTNGGVKR